MGYQGLDGRSDLLWLVIYLLMLFVLGLAFAFVNVSGEQISERMRKSGEYIYGVYPGQETSAYINHLVLRLVSLVPFTCSLWQVLQC